MIELPATNLSPLTWINLANVAKVQWEEEHLILRLTLVNGAIETYQGERAFALMKAIKSAPPNHL